eukprot:scaffold547450_cov47-Prasinocladus_malaysianus.AAC.1
MAVTMLRYLVAFIWAAIFCPFESVQYFETSISCRTFGLYLRTVASLLCLRVRVGSDQADVVRLVPVVWLMLQIHMHRWGPLAVALRAALGTHVSFPESALTSLASAAVESGGSE